MRFLLVIEKSGLRSYKVNLAKDYRLLFIQYTNI